LNWHWIASGKLSLSRAKELDCQQFLLLKRDRLFSGITMADTAGNSYGLTIHGDGRHPEESIRLGAEEQGGAYL
jgi:hypothetical protein